MSSPPNPDLAEVLARLGRVPNPVDFVAQLFAHAPIGLQIYEATGRCLLTNAAFFQLFGSVPPPEYNVLKDEQARASGTLGLIERAFAGETVQTPAIWYDPRKVEHVRITEGKRVAIAASFFPIRDAAGKVSHVGIAFQDLTAELSAREEADRGRREAEQTQQRFEFLAMASEALASTLDYRDALRKVAELSTASVADWCAVVLADDQGVLQRTAVVHRDPAKAELARRYEREFPTANHPAGRHRTVIDQGQPQLLEEIDEPTLRAFAQGPEHLEVLRALGAASAILVPLVSRGETLGVLSLMRGEASERYRSDDYALAVDLARRASAAVENARLYATERRAREEAVAARAELARERQRLEAVLKQMPSALAIIDAATEEPVVANTRHGEIFGHPGGLPADRELRRQQFRVVDDHGRPLPREAMPTPRALQGEVIRGEELAILRSDDSRGYIRVNAGPVRDEAGKVVAAVITYDDVSEERHRRDLAAFISEASKLLASSLDFETTLKTVARLAVPRLADWCGVELKNPDGTSSQLAVAHVDPAKVDLAIELRRRYPTDPNAKSGVPQVLRTGRPELVEEVTDAMLVAVARDEDHLRIARELGLRSALTVAITGPRGVIGALSLVGAESGRRFRKEDVPILEDLANRMGLAIANAQLYRDAQEAIRLRDDFLSVASHELKTPLTSLELTVSNLRRVVDPSKAAVDPVMLGERLTKVARQTTRLTVLINQLLDVSRLAAGRLALDRAACDLADLTREVVSRFKEDADRAHTPLGCDAPESVVGEWDRDRLDQVLTNLIGNALKYGAGKPVQVRLEPARDGMARLTVRDEGIGIEPAHQGRIFERFERAESARNYGGLGLGLWIVREIVEAHGGRISVQSARGQGATFIVELPVKPS